MSVMATSEEVTVSMAEVVMVKPEGEQSPSDASKTQVILQLQPITTSTREESAETEAAVISVESLPVSAEQTEADDVEVGCPITCGDCKAVLMLKKFVCPGINVKCVKYGDQLISPKQFVHISGKATLKDWKRAIRMGGVMLRKMMDSGQLDFYQHSTLCTNTCRSTKFDLLINNTRFPPDGSGITTPTSSQGHVVLGNGGSAGEDKAEVLGVKTEWSTSSSEFVEQKESSEISEDTLNFWKGIADVGLLGEVVTNISTELLELLNGVQQRRDTAALQDAEVAVLSNLAQVFGLLDSVKRILERRRQETDPSQEQVLSTLSNLEVQLEEQRKQQQVRALLFSPQSSKNKTPSKRPTKRPRLQRPASTTTLLTSALSQQTTLQPQQFTVLSPISLPSMGQPITVTGLPIGSLTQSSNTVTLLPAGSQFFTRYMVAGDGKTDTIALHPSSGLTLLGTTAMQDSGQLGTVVNPMELLQMTHQVGGGAEVVPMEGQMVDGTMLVQQEVLRGEMEAGQEHTVIEINPAPVNQTMGVMEVQLSGDMGRDGGMEVTMATDGQAQGIQGLQLDANGQLSGVQFMVIEENTQEEHKEK